MESETISIVVEKWGRGQKQQVSPVYRIGGFPWRVIIGEGEPNGAATHRYLDVRCEKSNEAELWQCNAYIKAWVGDDSTNFHGGSNRFSSWEKNNHTRCIMTGPFGEGTVLNVLIGTCETGEKWTDYSILDPVEPRDGIITIGEDKRKIHVNKQTLASQSPLFEKFFYGECKEKSIPVGDVEFEEISNMVRIVYGFDVASTTDENVHRELELAGRFELKIVQDRVVSYLLSSSSALSIYQKLFISEQYNIPFLMTNLLRTATTAELKELTMSKVLDQLSNETVRTIAMRCGQQLVVPEGQ